MHEKDSPEFWHELELEGIITLSDEQAIEDSMKAGKGASGIDYIIKEIYTIEELNKLCRWLFFFLEGTDQNLILVVKIVDRELSLRVYYEPPEFEPGNRKELIDRGELWLFQEPENPDTFTVDKLAFTTEIEHVIETENGEREAVFKLKAQGQLHGNCTCAPEQSGMNELIATIAEYRADDDAENPELLVFELGSVDSVSGGCIRLMLGSDIIFTDVDILRSGA